MEVLSVDFNASDAPAQFTQSIRATGFGVVRHHPIEKALIDEVYADWRKFFADNRKNDYTFAEESHDGFFPMSVSEKVKGYDEKDIKEYFHYYPWGKHPDFLGGATAELYRQMSQLAATILQWLEDNTPPEISSQFSMPLSEMIVDCPKTLLRILHYPPLTGNEPKEAVRAAAHTDINLITLLPAATEMGLQVQKNSGEWYDVPCEYGSIIVNIGDTLQMASQGYFPSTLHRVINPQGESASKSRMSLPLFLHARPEVRLKENFTAYDYWCERMREIGVLS